MMVSCFVPADEGGLGVGCIPPAKSKLIEIIIIIIIIIMNTDA